MIIGGLVCQFAAPVLTLVGTAILLRSLFITDEEIAKLADLPIREARIFRGADSLAAMNPDALGEYKSLYIEKRKRERRRGRTALWCFIVGFASQLAALSLLFPHSR